MKVRKTTHEEDLKFKQEAFEKLTGLQRLAINTTMNERMCGGIHEDWQGMVVRKVIKK